MLPLQFALLMALYILADKASLHAVEGAKAQLHQSDPLLDIVLVGHPLRVLIVDAMAVLRSIKKTPTMQQLSDLQEVFTNRIERMMVSYNEG
jgi:hypothetical protein